MYNFAYLSHSSFLRVKRALGGFVGLQGGWWRVVVGLSRERRTLTRPARGAEGARPVTTRHGSYQGVLCGGGRQWGAKCAMVGGGSQVIAAEVSGGRWPDGASPPPDRQVVGAGQIGRRRGSYRGARRGDVPGWWRPCSMVASRAGANDATIVVAAANQQSRGRS